MAIDWIKMRVDLQSHPKVVRILSAMRPHDVHNKTDKFRVIGGLHAVWSVFDAHCEDGILNGYTPETLDHVIGWDGFSGAMISVGWLIENSGVSLAMPEFSEHNGQSAKRRAEDQKRKRDSRSSTESVRNLSANDADKKRTREEKRREEKSINTEANASVVRATKKCPASFNVTADLMDWATEKCPLVSQAMETATFRDYTFSRAISDWDGAWRNWMRKAQKDAEKQKPSQTGETAYQRTQREKMQLWAPGVAAKAPDFSKPFTIEEVSHVAAIESR